MKEAPASRDVVFIVHGSNVHTWWRRWANGGYAWWRRWSLFCTALREVFETELDIREFRWSGMNTHEARLAAGKSLSETIAAQAAHARIHVVTHSHGGNVALAAINQVPPHRVDSLVLLANPHVLLVEPHSTSLPYWGSTHTRVRHIWNLFSEKDFIQTPGARWRHGFKLPQASQVRVSRTYEGHGQELVHNHAIGWRTVFGAHTAMHSSVVGSLTGGLLVGASFSDAMKTAKLGRDTPNGIPDRGGYGGTAWAYQKIRERGNPLPFDLNPSNNEIALLLVHGFTASPSEMRPLADFVQHRTAWRCKAVLLPGHGTRIEDMARADSSAWLNAVQAALMELAAECRHVFLVGLSLGAVLCCHAAMSQQKTPPNLRGVVLMAPAFGIAASRALAVRILRLVQKQRRKGPHAVHYFLEHKLFSYPELQLDRAVEVLRLGRQAWQNLDKLKGMPTLLISGDLDRNVSMQYISDAVSRHRWIESVRLPRSRHILTVEPDRTTAFDSILSFIKRNAVER